MGFFDRLFGQLTGHPAEQPAASAPVAAQSAPSGGAAQAIAPERVGLNGEYDQSGLAKRVAKAFDEDKSLQDHGHLWIAQHNSSVVLKGKIGSQQELDQMVKIARATSGATAVETDQVTIGL